MPFKIYKLAEKRNCLKFQKRPYKKWEEFYLKDLFHDVTIVYKDAVIYVCEETRKCLSKFINWLRKETV